MKVFQNDSETGTIFSQPPVFGQKFIQTSDQPGTFKCARSRCKNYPFIHDEEKMSGPERSTRHFNLPNHSKPHMAVWGLSYI